MEFEIEDLGYLRYSLGWKWQDLKKGISVSQCKYVLHLLKETGMSGCRPMETLMDSNTKLVPRVEEEATDNDQYQYLVGKLIYLIHTHPNISYIVSIIRA